MQVRNLFPLLLVVGTAFGQRPTYTYGNILNPGGVNPARSTISPVGTSHATRLGATVSGRPIPGYTGVGNRSGAVLVPYAYPVYISEPMQAPPPQQIVTQSAPSIIINNNYMPETAPRPVLREYSADSLPAPLGQQRQPQASEEVAEQGGEAKPVVYLLAMKDGSVYSAVAYWVEDSTLHYITPKHSHNRASLDLVDREITDQVNRERKVPFKLSR